MTCREHQVPIDEDTRTERGRRLVRERLAWAKLPVLVQRRRPRQPPPGRPYDLVRDQRHRCAADHLLRTCVRDLEVLDAIVVAVHDRASARGHGLRGGHTGRPESRDQDQPQNDQKAFPSLFVTIGRPFANVMLVPPEPGTGIAWPLCRVETANPPGTGW